MKIRNGFVSNSSSSSFVLIANTEPQNSKYYGRTWTHKRTGKVNNEYEILYTEDFEKEENYCRGNIVWVKSIPGKIKYIMAMYAYYYQRDKDYFNKILSLRDKIFELGKKHWYIIEISTPPLFARYDYDWDDALDDWNKNTQRVETYVKIYTECTYVKDIVDMVEGEDTTLLDSFIFNENSFAVLGGDEYSETDELRRRVVAHLNEVRSQDPNFSYIRFADDKDHEEGELCFVDDEGKEHKWEYAYHWEEDCFDSDPEFLEDVEIDGYPKVEIKEI